MGKRLTNEREVNMKICEVVSSRRHEAFFFQGDWVVCLFEAVRVIRRSFFLPEDAKKIYLSLHSRPGKNRKAVSICSESYAAPCRLTPAGRRFLEEGGRSFGEETYPVIRLSSRLDFEDIHLDRVLKPWIGKTVYLQVEYED